MFFRRFLAAASAALLATVLIGPAGASTAPTPGSTGCVWSGGGWLCAGDWNTDAPRVAGDDRYATSAALCAATYPDGAPAVYLANGQTFADAVSAATLPDGCVLLVPTGDNLPASVRAELARHAVTVVGLGGPVAVSDAQINTANEITGG